MEIARIARCMGIAFFAASLQALAEPPEGKGKPADAGPSPFIHFPVPQRAVGVLRQSHAAAEVFPAYGQGPRNESTSAGNGRISFDSGVGLAKGEAATPEPSLPGLPAEGKKATPECGAR